MYLRNAERMKKFKAQQPYLAVLQKAKPQLRKAVIQHGDKQLINCLRLTCYNILRGNIKLKRTDRNRLAKQKQSLLRIVKAKPEAAKKILANQRGGFISALLPIISGIAGKLFG